MTEEELEDHTTAPVATPTEVSREAMEAAEADGPARGAAKSRTEDSLQS